MMVSSLNSLPTLAINLWHLTRTTTPCREPRRSETVNRIPQHIQVQGEVSFSHRMLPQSTAVPSASTHAATTSFYMGRARDQGNNIASGRLDYCFGRALRHTASQSFLIVAEAKAHCAVYEALPQLLTYLACLRLRGCF